MPNVFLISDTHFGHNNICTFLRTDGVTTLRPFANADEMDEVLIERWNKVVGVHDKVYHLGDVAIARRKIATMARLNGKKVLIKGNHDIFKLKEYTPYFYDIRAFHKLDNFVLTHIPIHEQCLGRFHGNVHGHMHEHVVTGKWDKPDPRYMTVCVEHTDYTPVELSVVQKHFADT